MSKKLSTKRLGLLRMIADLEKRYPECGGLVGFRGQSDVVLEKYGLSTYDSLAVTAAKKAGYVSDEGCGLVRLTDMGRRALEDLEND
jgi:hypothetical protein